MDLAGPAVGTARPAGQAEWLAAQLAAARATSGARWSKVEQGHRFSRQLEFPPGVPSSMKEDWVGARGSSAGARQDFCGRCGSFIIRRCLSISLPRAACCLI